MIPAAKLTEPQGYYELLATVPAAVAFPPATACQMPQ